MPTALGEIAEDVDTFVKEVTNDTESIAISVDSIAKVAKYVGIATVVFIGFKIVQRFVK